ncbi:hypothetical protein C8F04DRAFT_1237003 [Mycena alexandri]|uniref:Uncharacterized protein n=1 Tax=Mycena alexandri TaxID=1745969 RepID=A0AAD6SNK9_9AGAR|nr:hypothetical protein C8F04DRAFT_1237003 [Mycena alexandri]
MTSVGAACKTNKPGYCGKRSVEPFPGIDTVFDMLQYVAKTHGTRDALGWRDIVNVHEEAKEVTKTVDEKEVKETKKWKYSATITSTSAMSSCRSRSRRWPGGSSISA